LRNNEKIVPDNVTQLVYGAPDKLNRIEEVNCGTWRDFQDKVKVTHKPFANRVFRGLSDSTWTLKSRWDFYREQKDDAGNEQAVKCRFDTIESLMEEFKNRYIGNAQFDTSSLGEDEWMALGRHHGLITPLLDWTTSPYVAAFFAYRQLLPIDRNLGCLNSTPKESEDGSVAIWEIPLESVIKKFTELKVIHSRIDYASRQKSQSGLFTLLDPGLKTTLEEFLKEKNCQHILRKYLIPKKEVIVAMHDLHLMNIDEGTMFPDADGAARQANLGRYLDWLSLLDQNR
jgi:hypothetical protein